MDQKQIGRFIGQLRKEKGLTQAELGEMMGVTNKTISRWENGNYMPDISMLPLLCKRLEININELLSGERLDDWDFREKADENIVLTFDKMKVMRREKRIRDFFCGAGTGILISTLYAPDGPRKIFAAGIAITMIGIGWYYQSKFDKSADL